MVNGCRTAVRCALAVYLNSSVRAYGIVPALRDGEVSAIMRSHPTCPFWLPYIIGAVLGLHALQVRYKYTAKQVGYGAPTAFDEYDCALVQRSNDSMRWWNAVDSTTTNSGANCPT